MPLTARGDRNRQLLGNGVMARSVGHGAKVLAERGGNVHVLGAREQHIFSRAVDFRELAKQIPDVGADAEIMELSRVYADAHVCILVRIVDRPSSIVHRRA